MTARTDSPIEMAGGEVELNEPVAPGLLAPEEAMSLQERARAIAAALEAARGSQELTLIDTVSGLGTQEQRAAGTELALLRGQRPDGA